MAAITLRSEIPVMNIVFLVAGGAVFWQGMILFKRCQVAGQAIEILVFAVKFEIRLCVMGKTPKLPVVGRVAGLAVTTQSFSMGIICGMTAVTCFWCAAKLTTEMTGLARKGGMQAY